MSILALSSHVRYPRIVVKNDSCGGGCLFVGAYPVAIINNNVLHLSVSDRVHVEYARGMCSAALARVFSRVANDREAPVKFVVDRNKKEFLGKNIHVPCPSVYCLRVFKM